MTEQSRPDRIFEKWPTRKPYRVGKPRYSKLWKHWARRPSFATKDCRQQDYHNVLRRFSWRSSLKVLEYLSVVSAPIQTHVIQGRNHRRVKERWRREWERLVCPTAFHAHMTWECYPSQDLPRYRPRFSWCWIDIGLVFERSEIASAYVVAAMTFEFLQNVWDGDDVLRPILLRTAARAELGQF